MKRTITTILLIFLIKILFSQEVATTDTNKSIEAQLGISATEYFKTLRNNILTNLPENFTAILRGKVINSRLETIPKEFIEKDKKPYVELKFSKKDGVSIEVKNVDQSYKNIFQQYVKFFTLGPILTYQKDDSYLDKYNITYKIYSEPTILINVQIKNSENNIVLYIDRKANRLVRFDYFIGEKLQTSTIVRFNTYETNKIKYIIPDRIITKSFSGEERLPDAFDLDNIIID